MSNSREVIFVYLGNSLPSYGLSSIELASRYSGLNVHLIGNANMARSLRHSAARFTAVEEFYDFQEFKEVSKRILYPHSFRQGFWLKTLERFFVLSQYMKAKNLDTIFHAELDQLLFRADFLLAKLDGEVKQGLFLPFHTADLAVASVLYCNSQSALSSLLDFASTAGTFSNEMTLIANWAKQNPEQVSPLPTMASVVNLPADSSAIAPTLDSELIGGVVDAAQLGWWVAGVDPRNVPILKLPLTKFADQTENSLLSRNQLANLKFNLNTHDGFLNVEYGRDISTNLFNLHIHSKVHRHLLRSDSSLEKLLTQANQDRPVLIRGVRKVQITSRLIVFTARILKNPESVIIGLRRRLNRRLGRRPASSPFLSGDTFRSIADHIWEFGNEQIDVNTLKPGDVVFCQSDMLEGLCERILAQSKSPITLLLGNSDANHTKSLGHLLANTIVEIAFAQNLAQSVPGVEPLPIGLENAWHSKHGRPRDFRANRRKLHKRNNRVMWAFKIETNLMARSLAANDLVACPIADRLDLLTPRQHRSALSRYSFVASPPGNGLDCHRTWEAMYLGCVPIVLRSHMTQEYERLGLPVWVIDSYDELHDFTEDHLRKKYLALSPKFETKALWFNYWNTRIKSRNQS